MAMFRQPLDARRAALAAHFQLLLGLGPAAAERMALGVVSMMSFVVTTVNFDTPIPSIATVPDLPRLSDDDLAEPWPSLDSLPSFTDLVQLDDDFLPTSLEGPLSTPLSSSSTTSPIASVSDAPVSSNSVADVVTSVPRRRGTRAGRNRRLRAAQWRCRHSERMIPASPESEPTALQRVEARLRHSRLATDVHRPPTDVVYRPPTPLPPWFLPPFPVAPFPRGMMAYSMRFHSSS